MERKDIKLGDKFIGYDDKVFTWSSKEFDLLDNGVEIDEIIKSKMTTFENICIAIKGGTFPSVSYNGIKGKINVIKDSGKYKGVGVDFGKGYEDWFYDTDSEDNRRNYIRSLIIL